jgi:hypothetical protein
MSVCDQAQHQRYRVYCSLGHKDSIQEYFGYSPLGHYKTKAQALQEAIKRDEQLRKLHTPVDRSLTPFLLAVKHRSGRAKENPMPLRHVQMKIEHHVKSHPDWKLYKTHQIFNTYPPNISFVVYKHESHETLPHKRWSIRDSRDWEAIWLDMVDYYIMQMPQYKKHKSAMIEAMPDWNTMCWPFIKAKAIASYGEL